MGQFDADFADLLPKDSGRDFTADFTDLIPKDSGRDFSADFADLTPASTDTTSRAYLADVRKTEPEVIDVQDVTRPARLTLTRGGKTTLEGATDPRTSTAAGSEFEKGIVAGTLGAQQMTASARAIPVLVQITNLTNQLESFDALDKGGKAGPAKGYHDTVKVRSQVYERATPERRAAMRAEALAEIGDLTERRDDLMASWNEYAAYLKGSTGKTPNATDIKDAQSFIDWFNYSAGQAVPYMAASLVSGLVGMAVGGPPGALTAIVGTGAVVGAGDISTGQLEKGQAIEPARAVGFAIPYGALDVLGPIGRAFRAVPRRALEAVYEGYLKRIGKEAGKSSFEEFINEAGQEIIKDAALAGKGEPVVTEEALVRWFNAGAAGAAPGALAGGAMAARTGSKPPSQDAAAEFRALATDIEATDLTAGTEQIAVDLLRPENAQLQAVEISTPTAAPQQAVSEPIIETPTPVEAPPAVQAAPSEAQAAGVVAEPQPAAAEPVAAPAKVEDIPADLEINEPILVEDTGETVQVKRNAREAFKEADQKVNRYTALIECMRKAA